MKISLHINDISESELPRLARFLEAVSREPMFTRAELAEQPATEAPPAPVVVAPKGPDLRAFAAAPATPFTPPAAAPVAVTPVPEFVFPKVPEGFAVTSTPQREEAASALELPVTAIEVDADGVPWDGRIHSSSKARTADGRWRARRGVADEVTAKVVEELKAAKSAPAPAPVPETPTGSMTFAQLLRLATTKLAENPGYAAEIMNACVAVGLPNLPSLASRPDLVSDVAKKLGLAP